MRSLLPIINAFVHALASVPKKPKLLLNNNKHKYFLNQTPNNYPKQLPQTKPNQTKTKQNKTKQK